MKKENTALRNDHELIRNKVGVFDFTMTTVELTGKDVKPFLDGLCVNDIAGMKPNRVAYTSMLDEDANMVDDLTLYCFSDEKYWMITAFPDTTLPWLDSHVKGRDVKIVSLASEIQMWPVQGPNSRAALNAYLKYPVTALKYYNFTENMAGDVPVIISRTGFTGELGYEIFVSADKSGQVIGELLESAATLGIRIVESEVTLESLPTEKGLIQMRDFEKANPLEMGMDWSIKWNTGFIGKERLLEIKNKGISRKLVGYAADDDSDDIASGSEVFFNGERVGKVTTANYGYTVEKSIGYILIDIDAAGYGNRVIIKSDGKEFLATLCDRVFYDAERKRINV